MKRSRQAIALIELVVLIGLMSVLLMTGFSMVDAVRASHHASAQGWRVCRDTLRLSDDFRRDIQIASDAVIIRDGAGVEMQVQMGQQSRLVRYETKPLPPANEFDNSFTDSTTMILRSVVATTSNGEKPLAPISEYVVRQNSSVQFLGETSASGHSIVRLQIQSRDAESVVNLWSSLPQIQTSQE